VYKSVKIPVTAERSVENRLLVVALEIVAFAIVA
jgi:hypothetical protein